MKRSSRKFPLKSRYPIISVTEDMLVVGSLQW